jgi:hypothetical protein
VSTIELCDLMLSTADAASGEVRVNIGNTVDGTGFGASVPMWGVDGFLSRPNAAAGGKAAQGLYLTQGNSRRVFASRDTRWPGPFGAMGEGDRALVSDCDAGLWLDKSANVIRLQAGAGVEVVVDGAAGTVTVSKGGASVVLSTVAGSDQIVATVGAGPGIAQITLTPALITLTAATVNVVGVLQVGGVPMTVP